MMETQYIRLNMVPSGIIPIFNISQYDVGRKLGFYVHIGAIPVDLDNYTCTIEATRKDGVAIITPVETSNNVGTFEVTATMSNIVNRYLCQLVLVNENSKRVASLPFYMNVIKAAMDENAEAIEEDASLYQQYTSATQSLMAKTKNDLSSNIANETLARQNADNALQANINAEKSARQSADATINSRIDNIIAPSGSAPSAAEVTDARVGSDGTIHTDLGTAIRTQVGALDNRIGGEIEVTMQDGYFIRPNDGGESENQYSSVTNSIYVNVGETYVLTGLYVEGTRAVVAYNHAGKVETLITGSTETSIVYTVPQGVLYIRATGHVNKKVHIYNADIYNKILANTNDVIALKELTENYEAETDLVESLRGIFKADRYFKANIIKYPFPDNAFNQIGVNVFTDKRRFITDYKHEEHKNVGGTTYYFSVNGRDRYDGLTKPFAKQSIAAFYDELQDGDTCILCDGLYPRSYFPTAIKKSINIIAEHNEKVIISYIGTLTFTNTVGNVYFVNRSNAKKITVILPDNSFSVLSEVSAASDCENEALTYFTDGEGTYINTGGLFVPSNENVFIVPAFGTPMLLIEPDASDINVYIEGITFVGGHTGGVIVQNTEDYTYTLHAYKCKFIGAYKDSGHLYDAISLLGGKAYFEKCVAAFSRKDGFNYHANNNEIPIGFELDCEAYCNGIFGSDNTNNGSTIHDGGIIIRINGKYHDNYGTNVADVHENTKSLNLRCIAFDSESTETAYSADFATQQAGTKMWLDCCKGFGSDWSIYAKTGTEMFVNNSEYINTQGGGTIDISWNPYAPQT